MVLREQKDRWEAQPKGGEPLYANGVSYQAYYSEHGKAVNKGKDLTEVRTPQRKLIPDTVGLELYEQTSLREYHLRQKVAKRTAFKIFTDYWMHRF